MGTPFTTITNHVGQRGEAEQWQLLRTQATTWESFLHSRLTNDHRLGSCPLGGSAVPVGSDKADVDMIDDGE